MGALPSDLTAIQFNYLFAAREEDAAIIKITPKKKDSQHLSSLINGQICV